LGDGLGLKAHKTRNGTISASITVVATYPTTLCNKYKKDKIRSNYVVVCNVKK